MQEHHFSTSRSARYFTLGTPEHAGDLWFVCHGYGQLAARFLERFHPLEAEGRCIVAPEGLSRFYLTESPTERRVGASWMTREDRLHEIDDYLRYLDGVYAKIVLRNARVSQAVVMSWRCMGTGGAMVCPTASLLGQAVCLRVLMPIMGGARPGGAARVDEAPDLPRTGLARSLAVGAPPVTVAALLVRRLAILRAAGGA